MRVKNFAGFMKTRTLNESEGFEDYNNTDTESGYYGANPEEDDEAMNAEDSEEGDEEQPEEELTLEDLKSMIDDLSERVKKLEPEEEEESAEGEEGEESAEGEEESNEK